MTNIGYIFGYWNIIDEHLQTLAQRS